LGDSVVALDGYVAPEALLHLYLASSRNAIETVEQSSRCDASIPQVTTPRLRQNQLPVSPFCLLLLAQPR
jgi:hypothetical protein